MRICESALGCRRRHVCPPSINASCNPRFEGSYDGLASNISCWFGTFINIFWKDRDSFIYGHEAWTKVLSGHKLCCFLSMAWSSESRHRSHIFSKWYTHVTVTRPQHDIVRIRWYILPQFTLYRTVHLATYDRGDFSTILPFALSLGISEAETNPTIGFNPISVVAVVKLKRFPVCYQNYILYHRNCSYVVTDPCTEFDKKRMFKYSKLDYN